MSDLSNEQLALEHIGQAVEQAPVHKGVPDMDVSEHLTVALVFAVLALNDTLKRTAGQTYLKRGDLIEPIR